MTRRRSRAALLLGIALLMLAACGGEEPPAAQRAAEPGAPEPYLHRRDHPVEYAGPAGTPPQDLEHITIAWFGPSGAEDGPWLAAQMALEEANAQRGKGPPLRLEPVLSEERWGTGVAALARVVYRKDVVAVTGAPDGPSAHLVEQVVAKARLPFVSPISTDPSTHLVNVPWIFSLAPGDHLWAPVLAADLAAALKGRPLTVLASTHHDARVAETAMSTALKRHGVAPARRVAFHPGKPDAQALTRAVRESKAAVVLVLADAADSARVVRALQGADAPVRVYGGPSLERHAFAPAAGAGVRFPRLWTPSGAKAIAFTQRFRTRHGRTPDYAEAFAYDAVLLLAQAVRRAGPDRVRLRDALRALAPWEGAGGVVTWDKTGQNTRPPAVDTTSDRSR